MDAALETIREKAAAIVLSAPAASAAELNSRLLFAVTRAIAQTAKEKGERPADLKTRLGGFDRIYRLVILPD